MQLHIRRRSWGEDSVALARRARRVFGAPRFYQQWQSYNVEILPFSGDDAKGEWIKPRDAGNGVILYFHGGGYVSCSAATHRPITASLARLTHLPVFAADYRLAPEFPLPAAIDDAVQTYQWLLKQGYVASRISFVGDSAGGGLVLALMLRARDTGLPLPACGICFSAWTDLAVTGGSILTNDRRCAMFHSENIADFAAACLGETSPLDPYASPLHADLHGLPPLLFQIGSTELLLDDSRRVHEKIQRAGGVSKLEVYDDIFHGWQMTDRIVPEARISLQSAANFIGEHLSD